MFFNLWKLNNENNEKREREREREISKDEKHSTRYDVSSLVRKFKQLWNIISSSEFNIL